MPDQLKMEFVREVGLFGTLKDVFFRQKKDRQMYISDRKEQGHTGIFCVRKMCGRWHFAAEEM